MLKEATQSRRVVLLAQATAWGGAESHTAGLVAHLAARGHEPLVACYHQATYEVYQRIASSCVSVLCLPIQRPSQALGYREWRSVLRKLPGDACLFAKGTLRAGSAALDLAARSCYRRYVTIEHLIPFLPPRTSKRYLAGLVPGLGLWWFGQLWSGYKRSLGQHHVVAVSNAVAEALVGDYRFPRRKVVVLRNGVDASRFRPDAQWRQRMRRQWGVSPSGTLFGAAGRLTPIKGFDVAIEALARLGRHCPESAAKLVILGEGGERAALEAKACELGIRDRVILAGFHDRPWEAYAAFDVFLLPSRQEAMPLCLLEAMAAGCYPIASNVGGVPEVIGSAAHGVLVPPENADGLAEAMRAAMDRTEETRSEDSRRVRQHVMAQFSDKAQFDAITDLLLH